MDVKTAGAIVHHVEFDNLKKLDKKDIEPISYEDKGKDFGIDKNQIPFVYLNEELEETENEHN